MRFSTQADDALIPTGEIASVEGTPLDFRAAHRFGARIQQLQPKPGGYDHNYIVNGSGASLAFAARAYERKSGRVLEVYTTEPGIQLYPANGLDGTLKGVDGIAYPKHGGFCLETQHFPDSVNHANFPTTILRPGQVFQSTTAFRFSAK